MSTPLVAAVEAAIAAVPGAAESWQAQLALNLAAAVEGPGPLTAKVSAGKELTAAMRAIGAPTPAAAAPAETGDRLDDLAARRRKRTAA